MADDNSPPEWPTGPGISESDAVSRMESLLSDAPGDAEPPAGQVKGPRERPEGEYQPDPDNAQPEGDEPADPEAGPDDPADPELAADEDAPDFWSTEDKEFWKSVPPELRPVLKKYEAQRIEFANRKAQEAAAERTKAMEEFTKYGATAEQHSKWWQANAAQFEAAFVNRWAPYTPDVMTKLSAENPAEWARISQLRANEEGMLRQAAAQAQESQRVTQQRQKDAFEQSKVAEHAKVAAKLPEFFGTPAKAAKTYEDLGKFLFSKGIPAERINTIHEAPIIEMALNAMRFEQAQKKASTVTSSGAANNPGNAAPKRIEPGPAQQRGNRNSEAIRQVGERFRKSADISDASELIRLRGL